MATVMNISSHVVPLTVGLLAPRETRNVDTELALEASLLAEGKLAIVDADSPPPTAVTPPGSWKETKQDVSDLPTQGNRDGDVRLVRETGTAYRWDADGEDWVPLSADGGSPLPEGGAPGQALVKASEEDGDTTWATLGEGGEPVPDAGTSTKGLVQLAGDLAGTAAAPVVKTGAIDNSKVATGAAIAQSKISGLTTALAAKADASAVTAALAGKVDSSDTRLLGGTATLTWDADAETYVPAELRADTSRPRIFSGPVNPIEIAGVVMNDQPGWDSFDPTAFPEAAS